MPNLATSISKEEDKIDPLHIHVKILFIPTTKSNIVHKSSVYKLFAQQSIPHDLIPITKQF